MFDNFTNFIKKLIKDYQNLSKVQQIIIVVIVALAFIWVWNRINMKEGFSKDSDAKPSDSHTLTCTMYYVQWCGHCKTAKPEWAKFVDAFNGKMINGTKILVTSIDCEKYPEIAKKQNINGYPTFKFELDEKELHFDGERTFDSFKRFVENVI